MPTITFSGLASGIDGDAVIKALNDSRRLVQLPYKNKREFNNKESAALKEFNTRLLKLRDMLEGFSTLSGGAVEKVARVSNGDAAVVTLTSKAASASASFEIRNLAKAATVSFADRFSDKTTPLSSDLSEPASLDIVVGSGESAKTISVEVDGKTTLEGLVAAINDSSGGSVRASIVNAGNDENPGYVLMLQSLATGTKNGFLSVEAPSSLKSKGLFASQNTSQAEDAILSIEGMGEVSRTSNKISDLFPGMTVELKQENVGPVHIRVVNDGEKTAKKFDGVISAINDLVTYSRENGKIERVEENNTVRNEFGSLAKARVDDQAISGIRQAFSDASTGREGGEVSIFADLGVSTERDGTYKFDVEKFQSALSTDPQAVNSLINTLADKLSSANGFISEYTRYRGHIENALRANEADNSSINDRIDRFERFIERQTQHMQKVFAELESTISGLNSQNDALMSMIAGLNSR